VGPDEMYFNIVDWVSICKNTCVLYGSFLLAETLQPSRGVLLCFGYFMKYYRQSCFS